MDLYSLIVYPIYFLGIFVSIFYFITYFEHKKGLKSKLSERLHYFSIIIPAYNKQDVISKTIKSIQEQDYPLDNIQIIVVDDGSTDKTYNIAKSFKGIEVYKKENGGKASALNYGIRKAKGEFIVVLDADTYLGNNLLKKAASYFDDENVGIVVPTLKPYKPAKFLEKLQVVEYTISSFIRKLLSLNNSLAAAPACSIFRASLFEKHGLFDEHNLTEDFEIALRAQANNYRLIHMIDAIAYTDVPKTVKGLVRQRIRWSYGALYNIKKYKHIFNVKYGDFGIFFFPLITISIVSSIILFLIMIFKLITEGLHQLGLLNLINYNINYMASKISFTTYLTNTKIFLGLITLVMAVIILYLAKNYTSESKIVEKINNTNINFLSYLFYIFIYSMFLVLFWIISIGYFVSGRTPRW